MDSFIGRKLDGRYQVLEIVGIGGMANVYKAKDLLKDKIVAVKILKEELASNDEFLRRFKNESKAIAMLDHPNIVKVFDVSFSEKVNYIVMEYIDGITLKEYIQQEKVLSWKDTVHFVTQILRALQHAHDRGIVHRDIKPQNMMILPDGSLKVMDFGIARFARSGNRTITDKAIGSVHYISPEQARGESTDAQADIYSTGVIMFEMLTGKLPFEADSAVSVAIKQISDKPVSPRSINPDIPAGLEEIVLKAMQKDMDKRYRSASEMLMDIEEFKRDPSINFQYKYFVDAEPTKYVDTIENVKEKKQTTNTKDSKSTAKSGKKKPNSMIILGGVAAAFAVACLIFVGVLVYSSSSTKGFVQVPDVVGMTVEEAEKKYPDYTFEIEAEAPSNEYEADIIIAQSPRKNGKFNPKKTSIKVTVSTGTEMIKVPDVVNYESNVAQSKLTKSGFTVTIETMESSTVAEGYVISTDPEAGTEVEPYSTIVMVVSSGNGDSDKVSVPDVTNTDLEGATTLLEKYGLKVGSVSYEESDSAEGVVIKQSVAKNTSVDKGTKVDLVISSGPAKPKTVSITFDWPADTIADEEAASKYYSVEVIVDGTSYSKEDLSPGSNTTQTVKVSGTSTNSTVIIRVDGELAASYSVNFKTGVVKEI